MATLGDLFYSAVDGTFAVDSAQRIIYWDPGCEELLRRASAWVLGRPCCDVMRGINPASGLPFCRAGCCVAGMSGGTQGPKSFPLKVHSEDGRPLTLFVNIALIPSHCKRAWVVMHLLHRGASPDILSAVDRVLRPSRSVPAGKAGGSGEYAENPGSRLTVREHEVLQLLAEGLPRMVIGKRLRISLTTVRNHIQHIQGKLGVHSQTEAVAYAYRHNFVH